jgi:4-hydroxymandelate oxidase
MTGPSQNRKTGTILVMAAAHVLVVTAVVGWWRRRQKKADLEAAYQEFKESIPPKTITEFEEMAMKKLPPLSRTYFQYFSDQALTARACREFYNSIRLLPRILQGDVSNVDTTLDIFGQTLEIPVLIAPTAFHSLACPEGEVATAKGAGAGGAGYCFNWMLSSKLYTDVLKEEGVKWLHLYMFEERGLVEAAIERALATDSFSAIILSCDHPHQRVQVRDDYAQSDDCGRRDGMM